MRHAAGDLAYGTTLYPMVNSLMPDRLKRFIANLTPLQWLEVAALAVVVIALTPAIVRKLAAADVPDAARSIATLAVPDTTAATLYAQPIWGVVRGDGEGRLAPDAQAIRLGAAIATYELKRRLADTSVAASANDVASLLESYPNGTEAANAYRRLAPRSPSDSEVDAAARLAENLAGKRAARLGAWLQGARFAAAISDSNYFPRAAGPRVSKLAITLDERADTEMAARQFEKIMATRPFDWVAISTSVEELLRLLGTR